MHAESILVTAITSPGFTAVAYKSADNFIFQNLMILLLKVNHCFDRCGHFHISKWRDYESITQQTTTTLNLHLSKQFLHSKL